MINDDQWLASKICFMSSEEFYDTIGSREIHKYQEIIGSIIKFGFYLLHSCEKIECPARRSGREIMYLLALFLKERSEAQHTSQTIAIRMHMTKKRYSVCFFQCFSHFSRHHSHHTHIKVGRT